MLDLTLQLSLSLFDWTDSRWVRAAVLIFQAYFLVRSLKKKIKKSRLHNSCAPSDHLHHPTCKSVHINDWANRIVSKVYEKIHFTHSSLWKMFALSLYMYES